MGNSAKNYSQIRTFDEEKIKVLVKLGRDLNEDVVGQMLELHYQTSEEIVQGLSDALSKREYPKVARLAHKFKSNCAQVGLDRLHAIATDLEMYSEQASVCELTIKFLLSHLQTERTNAETLLGRYGKAG